MSHFERSSNLREEFGQRAFMAIVPGIILLCVGGLMISYRSAFIALGIILAVIGLGCLVYGVIQFSQLRKVPSFPVKCPFCQHKNDFTEPAESDVRCEGCQRMIPIEGGRILQVWQVRCGYCNHLNYYSEKSTGLICESCNRIVPIAHDGGPEAKATFEHYTVHDDDRPYDLVLFNMGHEHNEELVSTLQHMLALNRNQVKDMVMQLPLTLLTGIPRKKAEMLKAQIDMHGGSADFKVSQ
ncbi:MAG: hypothetical protein JSS66_03805 [Armatimonadetes bacterium]|nr:hypothetical protein [Armatimonadota bacterium]